MVSQAPILVTFACVKGEIAADNLNLSHAMPSRMVEKNEIVPRTLQLYTYRNTGIEYKKLKNSS